MSTFTELRADQNLLDVTLACEDGTQIEAHKVVLTAGSQFFKDILKMKKKETLIIYMRGIKSSDLASVVDFLYYGEVNIPQEELNDFLTLAEELQLKGLVGAENRSEEEAITNKTTKPNHKIKTKEAATIQTPCNEFPKEEYDVTFESPSLSMGSLKNNDTYLQTTEIANIIMDEDLKQKVDDLIEQNGENWSCKVCGKVANKSITSWKRNLQRHTQIHMEGLTYTCNLCGKEFRCKVYLDKHMSKTHTTV